MITSGPWGAGAQRPAWQIHSEQGNGSGWISPAVWQGREPPRREWMVENCFLRGTVGMVSGDGSIGKSLVMLQLCCAAGLGREWLGLRLRKGRALYLACEDDVDELWRRTAAVVEHYDSEMGDLGEQLLIWPRVGQPSALITFERFTREPQPTDLYRTLYKQALAFGAQYIVIDTATKTFSGNQNDELQVDAYITLLRRLAIATQGCVILTKHPSLSGRALGTGESGNVAWNNSVRARLYFAQNKDGSRELRTVKSNYGPGRDKISLKWEKGVFVRAETKPAAHWSDDL